MGGKLTDGIAPILLLPFEMLTFNVFSMTDFFMFFSPFQILVLIVFCCTTETIKTAFRGLFVVVVVVFFHASETIRKKNTENAVLCAYFDQVTVYRF